MSHTYFALTELSVVVAPVLAAVEAGKLAKPGPWRPPEWSSPALTSITVPAPATASVVTDSFGLPLPGAPAYQTVYVFDAVLRAEHARELRKTEHPIQAAPSAPVAAITDHAFLLPARVTLDIAMSDAMDSYRADNWTGDRSKSISAYQMLVSLQKARTLVTLTTRLDTYSNMVIESIAPTDTVQTRHGLRATVVFSEVFLAGAPDNGGSQASASDRPQTTGATPSGVVQALPVPDSLRQQNNVTASAAANLHLAQAPAIPGAGQWSSVSISRLKGLLG